MPKRNRREIEPILIFRSNSKQPIEYYLDRSRNRKRENHSNRSEQRGATEDDKEAHHGMQPNRAPHHSRVDELIEDGHCYVIDQGDRDSKCEWAGYIKEDVPGGAA